jgi:hypothetical protein
MKNRNLSRILSSWVFLRYDEELTSWRRSPVARGVTSGIKARISLGTFATASSQIPSIELANRRRRRTTDVDLGCATSLRVKFLDLQWTIFGGGRSGTRSLGDASSLLGDFRRVVGLVFLAAQRKRGGGGRDSACNLFDELPRCRSLGWVFGAGFILHRRLVASTTHPQ